MEYNPDKHHRRSIRLKGYDYARAGLYFITICAKNRECLFGEIGNAQMFLNDAGQMIEKWYRELANRFPDKKCRQMVIMPNHLHCIIENTITETPVGTDLRVCPCILPGNRQLSGKYKISGNHISLGEHAGSPLHRAVQWFKTMTTNAYIRGVKTKNWPPFDKKLWKRNYYEHIIRDEQSDITIAEYIANNPVYWVKDELYDGEKE